MGINVTIMRLRGAVPISGTPTIDHAPTDILFSNLNVPENLSIGADLGTFFTVDQDGHAQSAFLYTIIDDDDGVVSTSIPHALVDNHLILKALLDFETKTSHTFRVRTEDPTGLVFDKDITIGVLDFDEGQPAAAPANVTPPSISGVAEQDRTLTVFEGTWTGNGVPGYAYQWRASGAVIPGAIERSYTLALAEVGDSITCDVGATNGSGTTTVTTPVATAVVTASAFVTKRFVRTVAFGAGNGVDFANAAGPASLNAMITQAGANGIVYLRADEGNYTATPRSVSAGGTLGNPCTIRGVTGSLIPQKAIFLGDRVSPYVAGGTVGPECFRHVAGANHLSWQFVEFQRCGHCFYVATPVAGLTFESCSGVNVRRFLENTLTSPFAHATITGLTVRNVQVNGHSKDAFRIQYDGNGILFEDVDIDSEEQDGDNFATGVTLTGTVHDAMFRRVVARRGLDSGLATDYWNADGFSTEVDCDDIHYEFCKGIGYSDAAFDLKSTNTSLTDCEGRDCKWNFKIWNFNGGPAEPVILLRCKGLDPYLRGGTGGSIQLWAGLGPIIVQDCAFADQRSTADHTREDIIEPGITTDVFRLQYATSNVTVINTSIQHGPGANLVTLEAAGGSITGHTSPAPAPTNSVLPVITGSGAIGAPHSVSTGTWTGTGLSYEYQWLRNGRYIHGAVGSLYFFTTADTDQAISARVFAIDEDGFVGEATSLDVGAAEAEAPVNTVAPAVTGVPVQGQVLTCDTGTWTGSPTFARQWFRGASTEIVGATGPQHTAAAADVGFALKCRLRATNGVSSTDAFSNSTAVVTASGSLGAAFYISPSAQGSGDGSSVANAAGSVDLGIIPSIIAAATAGFKVRILERLLDGTTCIYVRISGVVNVTSHGGATSGSKITIEGWNGQTGALAKATIRSNRTAWTLPSNPETVTNTNGWTHGGSIFHIWDGVNNLVLRYLNFERVDTCIKYKNGANCDGHDIDHIDFYNVRRLFDTGDGTGIGIAQVLSNFTISNIFGIGHSKHAIRIRGASRFIQLTDCDINSGRQSHDAFAVCYCLDFTAHDITMTRCIGRNCQDSESGATGFWNGDPFTSEKNNYNVTRVDCEAYGSADAGFDDKCQNLLMTRCIAEDNKENYKCWSATAVFDDCIGHDARSRGGLGGYANIQPAGPDCVLVFNGGEFTGGPTINYSSEPGIFGRATFNNVTVGSGLYGVDGNGRVKGTTVYNNCPGVPDNHATFTVPTFTASDATMGAGSIFRTLPPNEGGDVAFALISADSTTAAVSAGWTYFGPEIVVGSAFCARMAWKRLSGQTYESVNFSGGPGGTYVRSGLVWIMDGCVASGTPFEGYAAAGSTSSTATSPSTVVSGANRAVYRITVYGANLARAGVPAGFTQKRAYLGGFGVNGVSIYVDAKEGVGAGTQAASAVAIGASHPWVSIGFAAKPV